MTFVWAKETVERLTTLWAGGMSCTLIGAEIGVSRNAVMGKIHRLNLDKRKTRETATRVFAGRLPARPAQPLHIAFAELTELTCKWPYGDDAPFTFCGCVPTAGSPYCDAHDQEGHLP